MANIPVAQIPNAPQTGNGAVLADASAIRAPSLRGAGQLVAQGMSMLRPQPLPEAAFDTGGMGAGIEMLGNAGIRASNALGDFAVRLGRAHDEAQMAELDAIKTDLVSRFEEEILTKPADQWESVWQRYDSQLAERGASLRMSSPLSSSKLEQSINTLRVKTAAEVRGKAAVQRVNNYRQSMSNYIERAVSEGRYEDAMGGYRRGAASGLWSAEDAEAGMIKIEKETKWEAITQKISTDPYTESNKLQRAVDNNEVHPDYPELVTQADRVKALRAARGFERESISRYSSEALERVLQGEFETKEQVREAYTGLLPEKEIQELQATLDQTPEAVQQRIELYRPVLALIEAYDPSTDPDLSKRMEIRQAIRQVETGFQRDLVDQLNEKVRQNKPLPPTSVNLIKKDLDSRFKAGEYGSWKTDKDGNPRNDAEREKYEAAMVAYGAEATAFNEWSRRNPQATDAEAWTEINRIRTEQYKLNKAAGRDVPQPQTLKAPPSDQEVQDTLRRRGRGGRTPASVRNNNAGAMWYVAGSWQKKFGAEYGQKLNDGLGQGNQIAKFPTPVHGAAALLYQLDRPSYRNSTVRGAISKWSGGNNVGSYLKVLGAYGFRPDQRVSDIMASPESALAFAKAMARHETGFDFPLDESGWQQAYDMYRNA